MSMTSKVNPTLRAAILAYLRVTFFSRYNTEIQAGLPVKFSLRAIQEATQKLTREGLLVRVGTAYKLAPANATNGNAQVATAGTTSSIG